MTYALWAEENIGGTNSLESDHADNDSWNNFSEYVFGSNPTDGTDQPEPLQLENTAPATYTLFYTRNRLAGDIIFSLMETTLLQNPMSESFPGVDFITQSATTLDELNEEIELKIISPETQSFFRVDAIRHLPNP